MANKNTSRNSIPDAGVQKLTAIAFFGLSSTRSVPSLEKNACSYFNLWLFGSFLAHLCGQGGGKKRGLGGQGTKILGELRFERRSESCSERSH